MYRICWRSYQNWGQRLHQCVAVQETTLKVITLISYDIFWNQNTISDCKNKNVCWRFGDFSVTAFKQWLERNNKGKRLKIPKEPSKKKTFNVRRNRKNDFQKLLSLGTTLRWIMICVLAKEKKQLRKSTDTSKYFCIIANRSGILVPKKNNVTHKTSTNSIQHNKISSNN